MMGIRNLGNRWDDVRIDIEEAHRSFVRHDKAVIKKWPLYLTVLLVRLVRSGLWQKLIDSGFIRYWHSEFIVYWVNYLGFQRLKLHDFFYLHSHYRTKLQKVVAEISEDADAQELTEAWQRYESISLLFAAVYSHALSPLSFYPYRKYIKSARCVLEYGCGIAPITFSSLKYGNYSETKFTIADIKQFTYHFAKWRLAHIENVSFIDIEPEALPKFSNKFNVVFLMAVLEHLPNPLQVVKHIYQSMESRAYLIFNYVIGRGTGFDTVQSIRERQQVLEFIEENFELMEGKIDKHNTMVSTVVRKKQ